MPFFQLECLPVSFAKVFANSLLESVSDGGFGLVHEVPILVDSQEHFETAFIVSERALKSSGNITYHWRTTQASPSFADKFYLTVPPCELLLYSVDAAEYHQFSISYYVENHSVMTAIIGWNDIGSEVQTFELTPVHCNLVLEMKHKDKCFPLRV